MSGAKIDKKTIFQQGARIFYPIVLTFCSKKSCGEASGALFVCSLVFGFFRVDFYMPGFQMYIFDSVPAFSRSMFLRWV